MSTLVTDPTLIAQLEQAERAQQQPSAPRLGRVVTDPVLIRQIEAHEAGYMTPQEGEQWTDTDAKADYRVANGKLQQRAWRMTGTPNGTILNPGDDERPAQVSRFTGGLRRDAEWSDVGADADYEAIQRSAIRSLPGMAYGAPEDAGIGERIGVPAKQIGLDLLTSDQNVQADFLLRHFSPDRGYMFVPVDNGRVMLVHKDKAGKITRQLVNAEGISAGDIVGAAPQIAAAALTAGGSAALTIPARMALQGTVSGAVAAGQEGILQATGSNRAFDAKRVLIDAATGVGGEALASAITSATRSNGLIRNAIDDLTAWASGTSGQMPTLTPELRGALTAAGITPQQYRTLGVQIQRDMARRLPAAQARGGVIADDAGQTARNAVEAAQQGITPTHFHHGSNADDKALYGAALRGEHGQGTANVAREIEDRTAAELRGLHDRTQTRIADAHGAPPMPELADSVHALGQNLDDASRAAGTAAGNAVEAARHLPALRAGELRPVDRRNFIGTMRPQMVRDGVRPGSEAANAYVLAQRWASEQADRTVGEVTLPHATTEEVRRELRTMATRAGEGTPDGRAINKLIANFDAFVTAAAPRSSRPAAAVVDAQVRGARAQYADYIASYRAERGGSRGDLVGDAVERYATDPDTLADTLLGRNQALQNPRTRDRLAALVDHMSSRVSNVDPATRASRLPSSEPRAAAWDALRQSVYNRVFRNGDGSIRAFDDIERDLSRLRMSRSGQNIISGLFNRQEQQLIEIGRRTQEQLATATRETRIPGYLARVGEGSPTGRMRSASQAVQRLVTSVLRYNAVAGVLEGSAAKTIGSAAAAIAPLRAAQWAQDVMIRSLLRRGARDPMLAFRGVRSRAGATEEGAGQALARLLMPSWKPETAEERRFVALIDRVS